MQATEYTIDTVPVCVDECETIRVVFCGVEEELFRERRLGVKAFSGRVAKGWYGSSCSRVMIFCPDMTG
jgi:hypothetical protein